MNEITTVGIDLAKNVFSLHGVDAAGSLAPGAGAAGAPRLLPHDGGHCQQERAHRLGAARQGHAAKDKLIASADCNRR